MAASVYGQQKGIFIYNSLLDSETPDTIYAVSQVCPCCWVEACLLWKFKNKREISAVVCFPLPIQLALAFGLKTSKFFNNSSAIRSHFILFCQKHKIEPFPCIQFQKCCNWRLSCHYRYALYCVMWCWILTHSGTRHGKPQSCRSLFELCGALLNCS